MNAALTFETDLLRRYDRPGPRYTSYPTAPQFDAGFTEANYRAALCASNAAANARPLSLYLHLPFCTSPCFYCGCNRLISRDHAQAALYLDDLEREIALLAPLFQRNREVVQLHLGGGTPNFFTPTEIGRLLDALHAAFGLNRGEQRDYSIELDPRSVASADIAALAELGFNRVSLGVQDFDPSVQAAINREQSVEQTLAVIAAARAANIRSINLDLIYGLPRQTAAGFARTLDTVIAARPHRLAVYSYAHLPQLFRAQRQIDPADLPTAEAKLGLLGLAIGKLGAAGYRYIGMDHFALPNDELMKAQQQGTLQRNFMGYTTHGDSDLIGLGVSAISHVGASYSQNQRELKGYRAALRMGRLPIARGIELSDDDRIRAEVIQTLMCLGQVDFATIEQRFGIVFVDYFATALAAANPLAADGLVRIEHDRLVVQARGRLLLRSVAMCFDRYLNPDLQRYSRAI